MRKLAGLLILAALAVGGYYAFNSAGAKVEQAGINRVLEETGVKVVGQRSFYQGQEDRLQALKTQLRADLGAAGVKDSKAEIWIEFDENQVRVGTVYTATEKNLAGKDEAVEHELEHATEF